MEDQTILTQILDTLNTFGKDINQKLTSMENKFNKKFDEIDQKFIEVDQRFDKMDQKFIEIDQRFDVMDQKFIEIDQRFDKIEKTMDQMNHKIDQGFYNGNQRLDRLNKKSGGMRVELTETQETADFVLTKIAQHEQKLRQLTAQ